MILDLITVAVLVFFLSRIVVALRHTAAPAARRHWLEIVAGLRLRHLVPVPAVLTVVVVVGVLLVQVPGLDFGWWTAIGGYGNPVTGSTDRTVGTAWEWLLPLVFLTLLLPVLPLFAEREEQLFRRGAEYDSWARRAWRCVQFGLVHALVGIPIGFALALSVGGAYFMGWYLRAYRKKWEQWHRSEDAGGGVTLIRTAPAVAARRAALLESTRAHLGYNLVIVVLGLAAIVLWLFDQ